MIDWRRSISPYQPWLNRALSAVPWIVGGLLILAILNAGVEWFRVRKFANAYLQLTGDPVAPSAVGSSQREAMVKQMLSNRMIAHPMQLTGVLGDSAIFDGSMMVKPGESAGDMTVIAVGANWVNVSMDGHEQKLFVFQPPPSAMPMPMPMPGGGRRGVAPSQSHP